MNELNAELDELRARLAALEGERLPKVDRASRRRDRRQVIGGVGLFVVALGLAGAVSASALSGSNTVTSDDIVDGQVLYADIKNGAVTGGKLLDNSVTSADIANGTLAATDFAPGVLGNFDAVEVVSNTQDPDSSGNFFILNAPCPAGKRPIAGGGKSTAPNLFMRDSSPFENSWWVQWETEGNTSVELNEFTVYAVCVPD